jgi:hypothetical protein
MDAYIEEADALHDKYWNLVRALPRPELEAIAKALDTNVTYLDFMYCIQHGHYPKHHK